MRIVVRCMYCQLNQFETTNKKCRRCFRSLYHATLSTIFNKPYKSNVGELIYLYRGTMGFSARQVCALAHVGKANLCRVERGLTTPTLRVIESVAEVLCIPLSWLLSSSTPERVAEVFAVRLLRELRQLNEPNKFEKVLNCVKHHYAIGMIRKAG